MNIPKFMMISVLHAACCYLAVIQCDTVLSAFVVEAVLM
jgi:hypothetical protein